MRLPWTLGLLLAACATPRSAQPVATTCPATPGSPLFGCYRVVDANPAVAQTGIRPGSLLLFQEREISVFRDEATWARMTAEWNLPGEARRLEGKLDGGPIVLELLGPDRVGIREGGMELGVAVRLGRGEDPRLAQLLALPSLPAMQQRTRDCFQDYAALLPGDRLPSQIDPSSFKTTASAVGILGLARVNLLKQCKPVPAKCALDPMSPELAAQVAELTRACAP